MRAAMGLICGVVLGLTATQALAQNQIYSWVDKNGVKHYADKPNSPQAAKARNVQVKQPKTSDADVSVPAEQQAKQDANDPTKDWKTDEQGNKVAPNRTAACEAAQRNLKVLSDPNQMALQKDAQGKTTVLDGKSKEQAFQRAQDDVQLFCAPQQ